MSINSWVDDRVKAAVDYAMPKFQAMVEKVVEDETAKVFGKLDAQSVAILGTLATDLAGLAKAGVADVEKIGGVMADDVTNAGHSLFATLQAVVPGL